MRFWDSSALMPVISWEPSTQRLKSLLDADDGITVWWATPVECASALARHHRDGGLTAAAHELALGVLTQAALSWMAVAPSQALRDLAIRLVRVHSLRAADALQLGAALVWAEDRAGGRELVSLDEQLRDAARREGFVVLPADGLHTGAERR